MCKIKTIAIIIKYNKKKGKNNLNIINKNKLLIMMINKNNNLNNNKMNRQKMNNNKLQKNKKKIVNIKKILK